MRYVLNRVVHSVILAFGITTVVFFAVRIIPGQPFAEIYLSSNLPQQTIEKIKESFGLNKPILHQYILWLAQVLHGNFGFSFIYRRPVIECIFDSLKITALIGIPAMVYSFALGVWLGLISARKDKLDKFITTTALVIYSIPLFWLAIILILVFGYAIPIFPTSHLFSIEFEEMGPVERTVDLVKHIFLPALVLGAPVTASVSKFTRNTARNVINQTYIKMAKAKGLSENKIFLKHILPNVLIPVVTLAGLYLPVFLAGSIIVEVIFSIPGIGKLMIDSILRRDYPLVVGTTLFSSFVTIAGNLMADILYTIFDPRIKFGKSD